MNKIINCFFIYILITMLTSCLTMKEKYTNDPKEKIFCEIKFVSDKTNKKEIRIFSNLFPSGYFIGAMKEEIDNEIIIIVNKFYFLTTESISYTEGKVNCFGSFRLKEKDNKYYIDLIDKIEFFDFDYGLIRYKDNYIRNESGKQKVKERFDRVEAYSSFLRNEKIFGNYITKNTKISNISLREKIKTILFPELYGFKYLKDKNLLHEKFDINELKEKDDIIISDSIGYRKSYTLKVFPKNLQELRNSGTMLNDFESSYDLFIFLYNLEAINNNILSEISLNKIVKK